MRQRGSSTRDARTAWAAWSVDRSGEAGSEFLERVEAWMEGTAAQLARATTSQSPVSRDRVADRLRYHIGLIADGEPIPYLDALNLARHHVLQELRPDRGAAPLPSEPANDTADMFSDLLRRPRGKRRPTGGGQQLAVT